MADPLRISTISFLNPAPLLWDFEHPPLAAALAQRYSLTYTLPAQCAADLAASRADIGLIPIAAYGTTPGLRIVPGCTIASLSKVRSILLVTKKPLAEVRTIAADTASRSSVAYAQILFRKFIGTDPQFLAAPADLAAMLEHADAALLIGDPALLALEHRTPLEHLAGPQGQWLDLAEEWNTRTNLPWVAAFWAIRADAAPADPHQLISDFTASRDHGLANIAAIVHQWQPRIALPAPTIHNYLTTNIHYTLDVACIAAIKHFFHLAAECNVLPPAPPLDFL